MITACKPSVGLLGVLLLALVASAACQPSAGQGTTIHPVTRTPASTPRAASSPRPATTGFDLRGVGIDVWHPWYEAEASLLESQVAEFNQANDWGITVRARGHTSFTELYDGVSEALAGQEAPQLVIALPEHALAWDADGYVVDLAQYLANPSYGLSNDDLGDFPEVFLSQDRVGGRQVAMPAQRSAQLLAYNQSWAQDLGFDSAPTTPEEFREQACAAHAALLRDDDPGNDSRGGWLVNTDGMTFLSWLSAFGGGVLDGEGYRFLSPRNLEATVFIKQLYDDGCAWVAPAGEEPTLSFAARQSLFGTAPLEELSEVARAMATAQNPDEWTVLGFPGPAANGLAILGSSFVVLKSTPEEQLAAWLFVRWMLEPEQQLKWVEVTGLFPLRESMQAGLNAFARSHPQWADAVELVPEGQGQPQLPSWRQVKVMMGDGFDAMFRADTPAGRVAEILAIMDRTARDLSP
jgi:ABC-type glycerol-3-phosphate transport system substrate-binding protein